MKLVNKMAAITVFAACICGTVRAGDANPIEMINEFGLIGCDSLIAETFEFALKSSDRLFSINAFDERANNSVYMDVTFGSPGYTIWQTAHFEKIGGYCYSTWRSMINEVGNCAGLLNKDKHFKYTNDSAGALWAKNKGGVQKIFIQAGDICNQIFVQSSKQKATR